MARLSADVRLRPIRFAFLVRPDDNTRVLEICRVNTCLWGGRFNAIIPRFKTVPKWWDRHGHSFETARQIVNGYLDFFEPDFLVEAEPGLADGLEFDPERVFALGSLLRRSDQNFMDGHGQSVFDRYKELYNKEFQFARRHPHSIIDVNAEDPSLAAAAACLFGAFPDQPVFSYFKDAFIDVFEPKRVSFTGAELLDLYQSRPVSALRLGQSQIEVDTIGRDDPYLFVFDALEARDLIDFWNLRATRRNVVPIPLQFIGELAPFCREFVRRNHRPLPGNPHGVMIHTTALFGRSIPTEAIEGLFNEHIKVDIDGANYRQDWYPSLWQPSPSWAPRERRPTLTAGKATFDAVTDSESGDLKFEELHPDFAEQYGPDIRWANVVRIRDWSYTDLAATVFPCDYKQSLDVRLGVGLEIVLSTTEGIVHFPRYRNFTHHWELPDGPTAIGQWLKKRNITAVPSDAGRATQQIVQTLGGFNRVSAIAKPGIIKTLNEMSRRPITRSAHHKEFQNKIQNAQKGDIWHPRRFETLVERNAVELGLELKCSKCSSWSWYSLKQLDYKLTCGLCLREFGFPITAPGMSDFSKWSYRVIGPFALPDYARGGYAAALAMRFFSSLIGFNEDGLTWSAGQELSLEDTTKVEADFILWHQRRHLFGHDRPTVTIFGEAKSFGKDVFKADDIEHMKVLAERFPGTVLVFATMKEPDELMPSEVRGIAKLATWGREFLENRTGTRAPVIVLTGVELFASFKLSETWKDVGGRYAGFAQTISHRSSSLRLLADCTQQLYLGMPSFHTWLEAKWQAKRARRAARKAAQA